MLAPDTQPPSEIVPARAHWFVNPYVQISISIVLSAASQLFMKRGADETVHDAVLGFTGLKSGWVWLGILAMIASLVSWLYALRSVPLNIAYNLTGAGYALVPLASWIFFRENIPPLRWGGILLVIVGVVVIAKPLMKIEDRL